MENEILETVTCIVGVPGGDAYPLEDTPLSNPYMTWVYGDYDISYVEDDFDNELLSYQRLTMSKKEADVYFNNQLIERDNGNYTSFYKMQTLAIMDGNIIKKIYTPGVYKSLVC